MKKPKPTIEPINLTPEDSEKVQNLQNGYTEYYQFGRVRRKYQSEQAVIHHLKKIMGGLCACAQVPTVIVKYDMDDAVLVERYCDSCFEKNKSEIS